ncbi:predicted protein [Plenodomus lingam JN3]|uniref:Uncharacterized protein n=1 Tax=Leptosphaeria maculans (strain JN3 / isolate v23.1.3 / race Av1-4-5-6-7-8) TaxID=985895 RepID=E5A7Q7_LEPMJ|nr:predicted protein [Plenodomus lingam JN3]CBX99652.1 predicted protein [Plenodomus lingam JN3]
MPSSVYPGLAWPGRIPMLRTQPRDAVPSHAATTHFFPPHPARLCWPGLPRSCLGRVFFSCKIKKKRGLCPERRVAVASSIRDREY